MSAGWGRPPSLGLWVGIELCSCSSLGQVASSVVRSLKSGCVGWRCVRCVPRSRRSPLNRTLHPHTPKAQVTNGTNKWDARALTTHDGGTVPQRHGGGSAYCWLRRDGGGRTRRPRGAPRQLATQVRCLTTPRLTTPPASSPRACRVHGNPAAGENPCGGCVQLRDPGWRLTPALPYTACSATCDQLTSPSAPASHWPSRTDLDATLRARAAAQCTHPSTDMAGVYTWRGGGRARCCTGSCVQWTFSHHGDPVRLA